MLHWSVTWRNISHVNNMYNDAGVKFSFFIYVHFGLLFLFDIDFPDSLLSYSIDIRV